MPRFNFPIPVCFATQSGGTTLDRDQEGGNPFATALIRFSSLFDVKIDEFQDKLDELTVEISHNHQKPEWIGAELSQDWRIQKPKIGSKERRTALVLVVSDYTDSARGTLKGAAWDELRISAMLARHGFSVTQGVGSSRQAILCALDEFSKVSSNSDISIIYATGHGYEAGNNVYLIPGDYPMNNAFGAIELNQDAITISKIVSSCSAKNMNLVFFAGCRTKAED